MRKIVLFLIIAVLMISCFPEVSASADGRIYDFVPKVEQYYNGIQDYLANAFRQYKNTINISKFGISTDNIIPVLRSSVFSNPDIFYVDTTYIDYIYDVKTGLIETISPTYTFKTAKIPYYETKFNSKIRTILNKVKDSWSDYRKAMFIHDYIITHTAYKDKNKKSYTPYYVLVKGEGVCEGYAKAYSYLLSRLGIDSKIIDNYSKYHCWNLVKLGGKWYHVDVTSDDPTPDICGNVVHKYFLCSTAKLISNGLDSHKGFTSDISYSSDFMCNSTKYDSRFFRSVNSEIVNYGSAQYYINCKNNVCNLIRLKDGAKKVLKTFKSIWYSPTGDQFIESYAKLCIHKGSLYFNLSDCIYRYNIGSGKITKLFSVPYFWKNDIYGIKYSGGCIKATLKKTETKPGTVRNIIKFSSKGKPFCLPFLRYSSVGIRRGSTHTLQVYYGTGKAKFKSSNTSVARVSSSGIITAVKNGTAIITVTKNGIDLKCKIKVF